MDRVSNRNMLLRLLMIVFSITVAACGGGEPELQPGAPGVTLGAESTTESPAVQGETAAEDNRPGPLGIAVSGSAAGVSADYFDQAVHEAIETSGLFSSIADSEQAKISVRMLRVEGEFPSFEEAKKAPYFLEIRLIKVETPSFSLRMTVGIDVIWNLYRSADKAELMSERIESSYTGGFLEGGLHGGNRVRVAMEGAMRENSRIGAERLASVDFDNLPPLNPDVGQEDMPEAGPEG